jgi:TRAP-type C4-dicarboxylate transport system substrate-binding protein
MNKRWFDKLPADLQKILIATIEEESARAREATQKQQQEQIAEATGHGVEFLTLAPADRRKLAELSAPVYAKWGPKVGADYLRRVQAQLGD